MKQVTFINPPARCDLCKADIKEEFVDGRTCYNQVGVGLGTGKGQRYVKHDDEFIKEEG